MLKVDAPHVFSIEEEIKSLIQNTDLTTITDEEINEILESVLEEEIFYAALNISIYKALYEQRKSLGENTDRIQDELEIDLNNICKILSNFKL